MNTAWNLGRIAGIQVRMHWTFLLLVAWIVISHMMRGSGLAGTLIGVAFVLAIFVCIVLHETGHALAARQFGINTRDITLLPIGGVARLERLPREPWRELWIAIAGPLVNVAIAALLSVILLAFGYPMTLPPTPELADNLASLGRQLLWVNLFIVGFNLLPAFPTDGGRVLRAILAMSMSYERATRIAASIGQGMAILFALAGLWAGPLLLVVAFFIFVAAGAEAREVQLSEAIRDVRVEQAMMTDFRVLHPADTLQHASELLLAGAQQDFPVADGQSVVGVLTRRNLISAYTAGNATARVQDAMTPVTATVTAGMPLHEALQRMRELATPLLPVMEQGTIVGLLTSENIGELLMLRRERAATAQPV